MASKSGRIDVEGIFKGEGGVYILKPPMAGVLYSPPLVYAPPTPRRVFSGVGGWACMKVGPPHSLLLDLNWEFNTHTHIGKILSTINLN